MSEGLVFEHPLNERIRSFLRLEHLFDKIEYRLHGQREWDSREALANLIDIADQLARSDLKGELIKELERHAGTLARLQENPAVDSQRLTTTLQDIYRLLERLRGPDCQPGQTLRTDELVNAIKQRSAIPGGSCSFDLPAYHHWLRQPAERRSADLDRWFKDLKIIQEAVNYTLAMLRNSATPTHVQATGGVFQQSLGTTISYQLLRIIEQPDSPYFPEISGGRHRFTVRFMSQNDTLSRPVQTQDDVEFELHCCNL